MYSRIPMPVFDYDENDMKHVIDFLPWIGAVTGALIYGVYRIGRYVNMSVFPLTLLSMAIPLIVTGGFHVDGFMDVQDAQNSYQPASRKLEIMKDPHVGAFAVMRFALVLMLWGAALFCVIDEAVARGSENLLCIYTVSFSFVRALCGITSITLKGARENGMLNMETGQSRKPDVAFLIVEAFLAAALCIYFNAVAGGLCVSALILFSLYYKKMCYKEFGGVTGDTAGYFVVSGELLFTGLLGILSLII